MSIPSNTRTEYPVSSIGSESFPQNIVTKGSLWVLQSLFGRLLLKDYNGYSYTFDYLIANKFYVTPALKNDLSIDTDRFWVWISNTTGALSLYEIEPYIGAPPVLTYNKLNLTSNVVNFSTHVGANDAIRLIVLYGTDELKALTYPNIRLPASPLITDLIWTPTRTIEFSNFVSSNKSQLTISYLDVASPPNVYTESYLVAAPLNLSTVQVGSTNGISVSWDASTQADQYNLERDTSPAFSSPVSLITTPNLTFYDSVSITGTYYYRVCALNTTLLLNSVWSSTSSVTITLQADFIGIPLSAYPGDAIDFTDLSIPPGTTTAWDWDFGDGGTSTLQNPSHIYLAPGTYTVALSAYSGLENSVETKIDYITIIAPIADFIGNPVSGLADLTVIFTDLSTGGPTSWDWNFGDGSLHSTEQNPTHTYTAPGLYTVTLEIVSGVSTVSVSKFQYISVYVQEEDEVPILDGGGFVRLKGPTLIFD